MRTLAVILGAAATIAVAAPVSADPAAGRVQLAQAQDSGAQSGSGMGASQQGSAGNRDGGLPRRAVHKAAPRRRGSPAVAGPLCAARRKAAAARRFASAPGARA
jgi:hypothetical protein